MKTNSSVYLLVILAVVLALVAVTRVSARQDDMAEANVIQTLVAGNTAFALDLYGRLKGTPNPFFSPYSISTCLAMTSAGARGETKAQMSRVLHFNVAQSLVNSSFGALQRQLNEAQQQRGLELNLANGLWAQKSHPFLPAFLDVVQQDYEAKISQADFQTEAEPTRQQINGWVSDKTKGKIRDLLGPGALDPSTRLVLVNAIYFKGRWTQPFKTNNTASAPFHLAGGQQVQSSLMNMTAEFNYAEPDRLQVLELPYANGNLSMLVVLPREQDGVRALEVTPTTLAEWQSAVRKQKVNVFLPKFKLEAQFQLNRTLEQLGMPDAFGPRADFWGMDGSRDLFISAVVHKAYVDVNEEGTEAAAATGTAMKMLAQIERPVPTFRADHPFLFLIRDNRSGSILFFGRVDDPSR